MVKTIGIVSLSSGIIGEKFVEFEVNIGIKRLESYGIKVKFMENSRKGLKFVKNNPEKRAEDLLAAFDDSEIDMILCANGGDDTYRLLPYLFDNDKLKKSVKEKIFMGFSDTTMNHFMLRKVGLNTFYGQSFLADVCELEREMLPYSKKYFEELITTGKISEITSSDIWYENREDYSESQVGIPLKSHKSKAFELLQGQSVFSGEIFGGCIDTIYDMFDTERYEDSKDLCEKYDLFPDNDYWAGKILLLESSEEKMSVEKYKKALKYLKDTGIFKVLNGVIVGKPMDETYYEEYKIALLEIIDNKNLPIVYNINVGHATPRAIVPFGVKAKVNSLESKITFEY